MKTGISSKISGFSLWPWPNLWVPLVPFKLCQNEWQFRYQPNDCMIPGDPFFPLQNLGGPEPPQFCYRYADIQSFRPKHDQAWFRFEPLALYGSWQIIDILELVLRISMKYRAGLQMVNSHRSPRSWILSCEKHQHVGSQPGRELPLLSSLTGNPSLAPGSAGDLQCNIYPPSRGLHV